jgi:hypothetical protein
MKTKLVLIILLGVFAVVPFAAADDNNDDKQVATGHVEIVSLNLNKYSFAAINHGNGRYSGQFEFEQIRGDITLRAHGSVDCVTVVGNHARIGGTIRQTSSGEIFPAGAQFIWSVTDNSGARDTASELRGGDAFAYCLGGLPFPDEAPLIHGNVQVRP